VNMKPVRLAMLAAALLVAAPLAAAGQGVPVPQPAPKKNSQTAKPGAHASARPAAVPTDGAGRPIPVRTPAEWVPYDGSQYPVVQKISAYLTSVHSLTGNFVQIGPDGARTAGKFYIQKPGRLRFDYAPPTPMNVVADGNTVAVIDSGVNTNDQYPLSQTPLRYLLADQIDLARDTNLVGVSQDSTFISLTIEERQLLVGTHRLVMMFTAKDLQLRQWTITDPQGYETTVAVYDLDTVHAPDPRLFVISR
jgi:outer membrane lipoprotein-sorting protein